MSLKVLSAIGTLNSSSITGFGHAHPLTANRHNIFYSGGKLTFLIVPTKVFLLVYPTSSPKNPMVCFRQLLGGGEVTGFGRNLPFFRSCLAKIFFSGLFVHPPYPPPPHVIPVLPSPLPLSKKYMWFRFGDGSRLGLVGARLLFGVKSPLAFLRGCQWLSPLTT